MTFPKAEQSVITSGKLPVGTTGAKTDPGGLIGTRLAPSPGGGVGFYLK
jgi:hypothetical protein